MRSPRGKENVLAGTLVFSMLFTACKGPQRPKLVELSSTPSSETEDDLLDPLVDVEPVVSTPIAGTAVVEVIETQIPESSKDLENPYAGHVFNQRCQVWEENGRWNFECMEDWAELPLPGGSSNPAKNYLGSSTCNSASTAFVINSMVPPETIQKVIGVPGIDPMELVYGVYENLPNGLDFKMSSKGAGFEKIIPALNLFGLEAVVVKNLSWYSLPGYVENLRPGQTMMLALIGTNAKGNKFQHYTVPRDIVTMPDGKKRVRFYDSFFYADPARPNPETVMFEDSPNIWPDPMNPTGKKVDIVGAVIVEEGDFSGVEKLIDVKLLFREDVFGVDYQTEYIDGRSEFFETTRDLSLNELSILGTPIALAPNRFRVEVSYQGQKYGYYYFDENGGVDLPDLNKLIWYRFGIYEIPLFKQTDPEWSGLPMPNSVAGETFYQFGKRACGQAIAASILSMRLAGSGRMLINPYELSRIYFPDLTDGRSTYPKEYVPIFEEAGFVVERIDRTKKAVLEAAQSGRLVVVQGAVDFKWNNGGSSFVNHFLLVLPPGADGRVQIFDPIWGVGVDDLDDIDFSASSGVMALEYPK